METPDQEAESCECVEDDEGEREEKKQKNAFELLTFCRFDNRETRFPNEFLSFNISMEMCLRLHLAHFGYFIYSNFVAQLLKLFFRCEYGICEFVNLSTQIVSDNSFNDVKYCVGVYANDFTFHNLYEITTVNRVDYEIEIEFTKI